MFFYLYRITNSVNGKIYVGVHKTKHLDDGYMGSGKIIKQAIEKHGKEKFNKEILEFFQTYRDALAKEREIVTEEFLNRPDTYNLRRGGGGGFDYINNSGISKFKGKKHSEETKQIIREKRALQPPTNLGKNLSDEHKQKIGAKTKKALSGSTKSEEHKQKIADAIKEWHKQRKLRG